ncbi:MAG: hypothetical protein CMO55_18555 [Verrucomicrobiales bacterium]|nr:hypothetical protein [Verrucomicrobiales bacterium]
MRKLITAFALLAFLPPALAWSQDKDKDEESEEKKPDAPKVAGFLDIANTEDGSYPGGATAVRGKWSVEKEAKKLRLLPEPLIDGWLEFGPEIREKAATIQVSVRAPTERRIQSQMGLGLFGKNGFQLRAVVVNDEIELRRRGAVLATKEFPLDSETLYRMELNVVEESEDSENWIVTGRIWKDGEDRPEKPMIQHKAWGDELLFPLAGRPVIEAISYSGTAVTYASAKAWYGPEPEMEKEEERDEEKEKAEEEGSGGEESADE